MASTPGREATSCALATASCVEFDVAPATMGTRPAATSMVRSMTRSHSSCARVGVSPQVAQAVAAFDVGVDELKADFIHFGPAEQDLSANMPHADLDVEFGFGADAERVVLCSHAAAEAQFAHVERRSSP